MVERKGMGRRKGDGGFEMNLLSNNLSNLRMSFVGVGLFRQVVIFSNFEILAKANRPSVSLDVFCNCFLSLRQIS
jgi:hypothetical protein